MLRFVLLSLACAATIYADDFPTPFNTGNDVGKKPMPADEAVKLIKLPPGFKATVFAAEPDVQNPIACAWDSRGRLWVAENYTYSDSKTKFDSTLRDRILIFEDTHNTGHFDKRTVFADNLQNLTSIELGYGGVFATAAPYLLFIPDRDGDDKPDAPVPASASAPPHPCLPGTSTEILLDGFDNKNVRHNFVNGLKWGPDGWLYGRHGILATSRVGAPGTPDSQRVPINVGIWRYHPVRRVTEMVCWGGTNPWGLDWDAHGEGFFTNTVIGHLYHLIPGAHYERMFGEDANPHIYQLLPQTADHHHFDTSKGWTASRDGKANDLGGGHAHCGCMIYQGDNWPAEYRGKLFTINLHGRRINSERLERSGSGFVAKHEPDFALFGDPWFRGIDLTCGPDGGVYVLDWSDDGECHESDGVHRESGRIYKMTYGEVKKNAVAENATPAVKAAMSAFGEKGDLAALTDDQLATLTVEGSEWHSRIARRLLAERATTSNIAAAKNPKSLQKTPGSKANTAKVDDTVRRQLCESFNHQTETRQRLRALYALLGVDGINGYDEFSAHHALRLNELLQDPNEDVRRAAVSIVHDVDPRGAERALQKKEYTEKSPRVLLAYASAAARTSPFVRRELAGSLANKLSGDDDLPLVLLVRQIALPTFHLKWDQPPFIWSTKSQILRQQGARAIADNALASPDTLDFLFVIGNSVTANRSGVDKLADVLIGLVEGFRGRRQVPKPPHWDMVSRLVRLYPDLEKPIRELNIIFGDGRALDEIRALALDTKAELASRRQALETLIASRPDDLRATLETLATSSDLPHVALRGLATFADAGAAKLAMENYKRVRADHRADVMTALVSQPLFAIALLDAVAAGKIPRSDITPYHARQIATLGNAALTKRLGEVWGEVHTTSDEKKRRIADLRAQLTPGILAKADLEKGHALFTQKCAVCHTLYGEGGTLGPDLTGGGRDNLDYLLENIVDPSAVVPADFKLSVVTLKDGRVLAGFITRQDDRAVTLRTMTDTQTFERVTVEKTETTAQSLMPEGLLEGLAPEEIRDLFGFLMRK